MVPPLLEADELKTHWLLNKKASRGGEQGVGSASFDYGLAFPFDDALGKRGRRGLRSGRFPPPSPILRSRITAPLLPPAPVLKRCKV